MNFDWLPMWTAFPAHAGMNRDKPMEPVRPRCVPRPCGDEPEFIGGRQQMRKHSPHTRG
mgnify:CR=1 FL=1